MRLVFAGSDPFAVPSLQALAAVAEWELVNVIATPDRPAGRGMKQSLGPVPQACAALELTCEQPTDAAAVLKIINRSQPDFLITCAYGRKLADDALTAPTTASINIHASLLPRWRGAAPIERAIIAGDSTTGITTMLMAERIDAGAILLQESVPITATSTAGALRLELAALGARLIVRTLKDFTQLQPQPQDPSLVTRARRIDKAEAQLDWGLAAVELEHCIRGFNPHPGAFTFLGDERLKILAAKVVNAAGAPGTLLQTEPGLTIACGTNALELELVQPAGSRQLAATDWLRGRRRNIEPGIQAGQAAKK